MTVVNNASGTAKGTVRSSLPGIDCGADCVETFPAGTTVALTASPSVGVFAGWSGGGCSGTAPCSIVLGGPTTVTASFEAAWPDSVTRFCTDGASSVACPGVAGQDGAYTINVPAYVNTTETVSDPITGLMWERSPPHTNVDLVDYAAANAYCGNLTLATFDDWRLPSLLELASVVDAGRVAPPFPFAPVPSAFYYVWTSSTSLASSGHFAIYLGVLQASAVPDGNSDGIIHCVRGTPLASSLGTSGASVVDRGTGLTWQSAIPGSEMAWQTALEYCEGLELDGATNWRLPNIKELLTIVDGRFNPPLSPTFPAVSAAPPRIFWTSTAEPDLPGSAYTVDFSTGNSSHFTSSFAMKVRCVH